jgi:prophage regulatory protein
MQIQCACGSNSLHHLRIITQKELRLLVPYTPQHILRIEKAGKFPLRLHLGPNKVGWLLIEIEAWIASRRTASPPPAPPDQPHA